MWPPKRGGKCTVVEKVQGGVCGSLEKRTQGRVVVESRGHTTVFFSQKRGGWVDFIGYKPRREKGGKSE